MYIFRQQDFWTLKSCCLNMYTLHFNSAEFRITRCNFIIPSMYENTSFPIPVPYTVYQCIILAHLRRSSFEFILL